MTKLSAKQIETLRQVHQLTTANGFPPSIDELRKALGLASDQGVIDMLQRLEGRGLIEKRVPGQARSLQLSSEGFLAIGEPSRTNSSTSALGSVLQMNPVQQRIHARLSEIDPKLSQMYEGGLRVLLDPSNPERIALSAHSIREGTYHLSHMGKVLLSKEEARAENEQKVSNARQLGKLFDPLGGARHFDRTIYDRWNKDFHLFFVEVSHHGRDVGIDDYRLKLAEYEQFLDTYVLPLQTEIYARLDEQLRYGPGSADPEDLHFLLSRNLESYRYFFRKADVRWLDFLTRNGMLRGTWETADYLARIAPEANDEVMSIIEQMTTRSDDWSTRRGFVEAAFKMNPAVSRRLIPIIKKEKWLAEPYADWLSHILNQLLVRFIESKQHDDARALVSMMLDRVSTSNSQVHDYHYESTLTRFADVPPADLPQYVRLLVQTLERVIKLELRASPEEDLSFTWRPAIEDHDQNKHHQQRTSHLVTALRDALSRHIAFLIGSNEQNLRGRLDELLNSQTQFSVFPRLRLHLYRTYASHFMQSIEQAVLAAFDDTSCRHEYHLLLKQEFMHLTNDTRNQWFELLDRGPEGDRDLGYSRRWKAQKLSPVIDLLTPEEHIKYHDLIPTAQSLEHPDFLSHMGGVWVGPTSPLAGEDLKAMSIDSILDHLASWTPTNDWFAPSREGLGRELSEVVKERAGEFSAQAFRFGDKALAPVYVYHFFYGLREPIKNNIQIDWKSVIALAIKLVEQAQSGSLPVYEVNDDIDAWEVKWDATFQEIAALIEAGLVSRTVGLPFEERKHVWQVIEFLCEHPDPSPQHERDYGGNNMDPFSMSINTVRGRAFHALFDYMFWCDRHLGAKKERDKSRIASECKAVLEAHLVSAHDPSLTIRSVYGRFLPWLFVYDPAWTSGICEKLFPVKDKELRYAAWETYLSNSLFPKVYDAFKPQYELAITELRKFTKTRRYWADPTERLGDHMMIAYAYRTETDKTSLWTKFFRLGTPKQRAHAISFAGRAWVLRDSESFNEIAPNTGRLQEFWEWRLAESGDREELQAFGWWVRAGKFTDEWMLRRLIETLTKTDGAIEADIHVLEALSELASQHPQLCGQALTLIVKSRFTERWILDWTGKVYSIIMGIHASEDAESKKLAIRLVDHLTKLGYEHYRHILDSPNPAPASDSTNPFFEK